MNKYEQLNMWFVQACRAMWMPPYVFSCIEKKTKKYTMKVEVDPTYLTVTIHVDPKFWDFGVKKQRIYLAHELWHVFAFKLDSIAEDALERLSVEDEENGSRLDREYTNAAESMADHAAQLLIPVLPEWNGVQVEQAV